MAVRKVALSLLLCLLCIPALGQGILPFKTVQNNGVDVIDLSTLNILVNPTFPQSHGGLVISHPVNSLPYSGLDPYQQVQAANLGTIFDSNNIPATCPNGQTTRVYTGWTYTEPNGTHHSFPNAQTDSLQCLTQRLTDTTTDGSGLTIVLTGGQQWQSATVYDVSGGAHTFPGSSTVLAAYTDRDGNVINWLPNGRYTDVFGNTVDPHSYADAAGTSRSITESLSSVVLQNVCTGTTSNGTTHLNSIAFPDSTSMGFTYEPYGSNWTGRLATITLRTGGTIYYAYSGGTNGVNCSDHTTATLARSTSTLRGTSWTYTHVPPASGSNISTTTVIDPYNIRTVYTFASGYEIQRIVYDASGNVALTVSTCYNGATNCAAQTAVTLPILQKDVKVTLAGMSSSAVTTHLYTSQGVMTEEYRYDFGATTPTTHTVITYGSYNGSTCVPIGNNIVSLPCKVEVYDGSSTLQSQVLYAYDARGNLGAESKLVRSGFYLTTYHTYNANGSLATTTDPNGAVTTFSNYTCNGLLPQTVSYPLGLTESKTWDCNTGAETSNTDPNSQTSYVNYTVNSAADPMLRPLGTTDPLNNLTHRGYYGANGVEAWMTFGSSISDSLKHIDSLGRIDVVQRQRTQSSSNGFDSVQNVYDSDNRIVQRTVPYFGATMYAAAPSGTPYTSYTYDVLGRASTVTNPNNGTVTYTYNKQDVLMTVGPVVSGERTKQRQYEYDGLGRLRSVCEITNAPGSVSCGQANTSGLNFTTGYVTQYTYTTLGQLASVTQSGQTRTFTYDDVGRLTSESNPESGTTGYAYDNTTSQCAASTGDLVQKTDANGNVLCYQYDSLHRLTTITNSSNTTSKWFYYDNPCCSYLTNTAGRLWGAHTCPTSAGCVSNITDELFSYNARGELTDVYEKTPHSGGYYHVSASYFPNGAIQALNNLGNGFNYGFNVDGEGRLNYAALTNSTLTQYVSNVTYDYASRPLTISYTSGDSDTYTYDPAGGMKTYKYAVGSASLTGTLNWNANGSLGSLAVSDGFTSAGTYTCAYSHDDLLRVASASCGSLWSQTFSYDAFGNITKNGTSAWVPGYNPANNRYLSPATYDAAGHLLYDTFHNYTWDAYDRPMAIDSSTFTYDAFGRMVEKNVSGTTTEIEYGPAGRACSMNGQAQVQCITKLPGGSYLARGPETIWHRDWQGSIRLGSSPANRTVTFDRGFGPFGEMFSITGGMTNVSFTGLVRDSMQDEYDTPNRQLHPGQGRWISPDPAGLGAVNPANPQSWNRYAYALNNPLLITDPSGLDGECTNGQACNNPDSEQIESDDSLVFNGSASSGVSSSWDGDVCMAPNADCIDFTPNSPELDLGWAPLNQLANYMADQFEITLNSMMTQMTWQNVINSLTISGLGEGSLQPGISRAAGADPILGTSAKIPMTTQGSRIHETPVNTVATLKEVDEPTPDMLNGSWHYSTPLKPGGPGSSLYLEDAQGLGEFMRRDHLPGGAFGKNQWSGQLKNGTILAPGSDFFGDYKWFYVTWEELEPELIP